MTLGAASPGLQLSREAAAACSRGRKPGASHWKRMLQPPEPRRRRQQLSLVFDLKQAPPHTTGRIIRG